MILRKVISGGQTGADQGALAAAKILGLDTGGWMPKGFRTETGPRPDLAAEYRLDEYDSGDYADRTLLNIDSSHATLLFGNAKSSGSALTRRLCQRRSVPVPMLYVPWYPDKGMSDAYYFTRLPLWLEERQIQILNVAGNRESRAPGIHDATRDFLLAALAAPSS